MTPAELADVEAIKQLKARYFRYLDTKQWQRWRALFTDDCALPGGRYANVDDLVATIAAERETATTIHQGHTPEIVLTEPQSARGIWAMSDRVQFAEPARSGRAEGYWGFVGAGHYEEEYRKDAGVWRISSMRLTRLWVEALVDPPAPQISGYPESGDRAWLPADERG